MAYTLITHLGDNYEHTKNKKKYSYKETHVHIKETHVHII